MSDNTDPAGNAIVPVVSAASNDSIERETVEFSASQVDTRCSHGGSGTAGFVAGQVVGDYELMERLGAGGMGVVYRARHLSANRVVAVKMVRADRLLDLPEATRREFVERFHTEARATARLQHENIVTLYDVGELNGAPFYSMRYVAGHSLRDVLRDGPIECRRAATIMEQTARAVEHAHRAGVLHRDIKPHNILLDASDRPLISDFGLAKCIEEGAQGVTQTGQIMGTPEYMSPEQAKDSAHITIASDVYGLGATLYELLIGRPPFQAATPIETLRLVIERDPVAPRQLNPTIDPDLETITVKCLEKDPARRYASAGEMACDLKHYLKGEPIVARPAGSIERLWRWCRRNPRLAGFGTVAAASLTAVAIVSLAAAIRIADQKSIAEEQKRIAQQESAAAETARQQAEAARNAAEESEQAAIKSARVTEAINKFFLEDMLEEASPERNPVGIDIKLRDVVDRASENLDTEFADEPELELALRETIAGIYRDLTLYPQAITHSRRILELAEEMPGPQNRTLIEAVGNLALILQDAGSLSEAQPLHERCLQLCRDSLDSDDPVTLTAMNNLGLLLAYQGQFNQSAELLQQTLDARRRVLGPDHEHTISTGGNVAIALQELGRLADAEPLQRKALEWAKNARGEEHPYTLTTMQNYGLLLVNLRKLEEAEALYRELVDKRRHALGPDHEHTIVSEMSLAQLLNERGKLDEAEPYFVSALKAARHKLGIRNNITLTTMHNYSLLLQKKGEQDAAIDLMRETWQMRCEVLTAQHPYSVFTQANLGAALAEAGKFDEAEPLLREACTSLAKILPSGNLRTIVTLNALGACLTGLGRYDDAEPLLIESFGQIEATAGLNSVTGQRAIRRLIKLYEAWHKPEKAAEWNAKL
jgi:tRNA A-37 threonylcarbamoyl transferase component Bud32